MRSVWIKQIRKRAWIGGAAATGVGAFSIWTARKPEQLKWKIVFDLDQTLVHYRYKEEMNAFEHFGVRNPDRISGKGDGIWLRPLCIPVIQWVSYFNPIYLFTAGTEGYAKYVLKKTNLAALPWKAVISRRACVDPEGYGKDMKTVDNESPWRCILVDDRLANRQPGQAIIHIPPFEVCSPRFDSDMEMPKLLLRLTLLNLVGPRSALAEIYLGIRKNIPEMESIYCPFSES